MIRIVPKDIDIDFVTLMKRAYVVSIVVVSLSLILLLFGGSIGFGPKLGIDFAGGTEIQLQLDPSINIEELRAGLETLGLGGDSVQRFGPREDNNYLVRVQNVYFGAEDKVTAIMAALKKHYGEDAWKEPRYDPEQGISFMAVLVDDRELTAEEIQAKLERDPELQDVLGTWFVEGGPLPMPAPAPETPGEEAPGEEQPEEGEPAEDGAGDLGANGDGLVQAGEGADPDTEADSATEGSELLDEGEEPAADDAAEQPAAATAGKASTQKNRWVSSSLSEHGAFVVQLPGLTEQVKNQLKDVLGEDKFVVQRVESVGAKVGRDLRRKGATAVLISLLLILIYIAIRFDLAFSPGAVVALIHDVFVTMGVFILLGMEFNITIIAALLTIVGYSLNDTIVVYDRIRENLQRFKRRELGWVVNRSINETLSRTLMTSLTTAVVVMCLLFLGGPIIRPFSVALLTGVLVGTYSSVFVASPLILFTQKWLPVAVED